MASPLRQKQTERRKGDILAAAGYLFSTKGYQETNVEEVAQRAEVGVATIYKYFGAKGGLIRELLRPQIASMRVIGQSIIDNPPEDPAEAMSELISHYNIADDWRQRDLMRALCRLDLGYADIFEGLRDETDSLVMSQICRLLAYFEKKGSLAPGLSHPDIAAIISGLLNQHFQYFTTHPNLTREQVLVDMRRRIRLLFENWRTPG